MVLEKERLHIDKRIMRFGAKAAKWVKTKCSGMKKAAADLMHPRPPVLLFCPLSFVLSGNGELRQRSAANICHGFDPPARIHMPLHQDEANGFIHIATGKHHKKWRMKQ